MPLVHRAMVTDADQVTATVADLTETQTTEGHPVVVVHPGAVEAAELALRLQERGKESLLHDGWIELVHRSAGTTGISAAAGRVAEHDKAAPCLVIIHPLGPASPSEQHRSGCFGLAELTDWTSCTCVFGAAHATAAGLPTLIRHPRVSINDIALRTDQPEGRLLLVDFLLDHLHSPVAVHQLALALPLRDLERRALDKLVARRMERLNHIALAPATATRQHNSPQPVQHDDLCQLACAEIGGTDGQLDRLLATLHTRVGAELLLEDSDFRPLAWSTAGQQPASLAELITPQRLNRLVDRFHPGLPERVRLGAPSAGYRLVMRIGSKETLGYLSATSPRRDDATTSSWLRHATPILAGALARHGAHQQLRAETRRQLVTMLAHGLLSPPSARLAVEELVGPFGTRIAALDNTTSSTPDGWLTQQLRALNLPHGNYQGLTIALLDNKPETPANLYHRLHVEHVVIGVGSIVNDATELPASARQAVWAFRIALATHRPMLDFAGIGIHRLLLPGAEGGDPEFEEPIRRIEEAAEVLGFDGLHTLVGYLDAGGNMRRAARELAIHVNTLRARIQRITRIVETDLTDPEQRFRLQLAARLRAGRRAMQEDLPPKTTRSTTTAPGRIKPRL